MKAPIKLASESALAKVFGFLPKMQNPSILLNENLAQEDFTKAVSTLKFGKTFKTTKSDRHKQTDKVILEYCKPKFSFLDVGASTGITSLELIEKLEYNFDKFYVTDYNLHIDHCKLNGKNFFYNETGQCLLISDNLRIIYPQESKLIHSVYNSQITAAYKTQRKRILLINPDLKQKAGTMDSIIINHYNVLNPWFGESVNVIKAANLFNKAYFSDQEIITGIENLYRALLEGGLLVIIDNRINERSTIFQKKKSGLLLIKSINQGTEIQELINKYFLEKN